MRRIIVIDDEPGAMCYYRQALLIHNYEVESFVSAEEAKRWLTEVESHTSQPAAVVLDLTMPPGEAFTMQETRNGLETGLALLDLIRKRYPHLPVLILSQQQEKVIEMQKSPSRDAALRVVSKYEAPPFTVVRILDEMTKDWKKKSQHE